MEPCIDKKINKPAVLGPPETGQRSCPIADTIPFCLKNALGTLINTEPPALAVVGGQNVALGPFANMQVRASDVRQLGGADNAIP
jgi:hypothetical protein